MSIFKLTRLAHTIVSTRSEITDPSGACLSFALERAPRGDHCRIPPGPYTLKRRKIGESHFDRRYAMLMGPRYKGMIEVCGVPGRTDIEIHAANVYSDLRGCVAPGLAVVKGPTGWEIPNGQSTPAFIKVYAVISDAIDAGVTVLSVADLDGG